MESTVVVERLDDAHHWEECSPHQVRHALYLALEAERMLLRSDRALRRHREHDGLRDAVMAELDDYWQEPERFVVFVSELARILAHILTDILRLSALRIALVVLALRRQPTTTLVPRIGHEEPPPQPLRSSAIAAQAPPAAPCRLTDGEELLAA